MGKFLNQNLSNSIENTINNFKERLQNPYYSFNQQKPTVVDYYNINIDRTSFDEASGLNYASLGPNSSIKYNKINKLIIYGIDRMEVTTEMDEEEGTQSQDLTGNAMIVPNTITPYPGDYFKIPYLKEELLFRVIEAQSDTLDNGSNVWVISYKVEHNTFEGLDENVIEEYNYVINNIGTAFNPILKKSTYDLIDELDTVANKIRVFYVDIFYSDRVQSLIFDDLGRKFYDSYLTEFIIRTGVLHSNYSDYIYISHQLRLPKTFAIDYDRSFFRMVETKNKNKITKAPTAAYGMLIESATNIFSTRLEEYFELVHDYIDGMTPDMSMFMTFDIVDRELLERIYSGTLGDNSLDNIIIKYFNDIDLNREDIDALEDIDYKDNCELFFKLPVIIYIVEYYIKKLMCKDNVA